jgi:hypothetical protein
VGAAQVGRFALTAYLARYAPSLPIAGNLPAQDTVGLPAEEWMISLTRTGHRCFIRLVKAIPELDDLTPVLLPIKRLTASTDSVLSGATREIACLTWTSAAWTCRRGAFSYQT